MARPRKTGLDYFPHDVDVTTDPKIEPAIMRYGAAAYAFYFIHLEYCYRSDDLSVDVSATETGAETTQSIAKKSTEKNSTSTPLFPKGEDATLPINLQEKRFEEFWAAYPKKIGKQAAFKSWQRIKPTSELHSKIMEAVTTAKQTEQWQRENGRYIPSPTTWLNQGRWDDEITEVTTDIQNRSNYKQDYKMAAGQMRKAGSAAPGFKLAGEPDDEYEQARQVLSGFHMAE